MASAAAVRRRFEAQPFMEMLGASIGLIANGRCTVECPLDDAFTQQHDFAHARVVTALADTAAGFAAYSALPEEASVLTVELKINLLAPACGELLRARALVLRSGRLSVCRATVWALAAGRRARCATALVTISSQIGT